MEINSKRLLLKRINNSDLDNYIKLVTNVEVMKLISGIPFSEKDGRARFQSIIKKNITDEELGYYSIFLKSNNQFIGYSKLVETNEDKAELGYVFLPTFWGKGFGSEVSKTMVDFAKTISKIKILIAIIDPENDASKKILLNSGFYLHKVCEMDGLPAEVYQLQTSY